MTDTFKVSRKRMCRDTGMHEFETFVYLDTQKTGSSFISYVLRRHSSEKEVLHSKHQPVGERYDPNKFYFISVRDPFDQYISL